MREKRSLLFFFAAVMLFLVMGFRLFQLQILDDNKYRKLARENASRLTPILAPRGIIYDKNGKVMIKNRPIFTVFIAPHNLPQDYMPAIKLLSQIIGVPYAEIEQKLLEKKKSYQFGNVKIVSDLPLSSVTKIYELQEKLPGVTVVCQPMRSYPYKNIGIHVLGYIGEIEQRELQNGQGYRLGDLIGKDGVEKQYDKYIRGISGGEKVEVDARGKPGRNIETLDPQAGNDVILTIDIELQEEVEKRLSKYNGAVVILDPRTGAVLAMASYPSYDPAKKWNEINQRNHPFMNRALSSYPPGSIFKVVTLTAALSEKVTSLTEYFTCHGFYKLGRRIARCWLSGGHGRLNPQEGLVQSCDVVFYELGKRLGPEKMYEYARKMGLGDYTGIDLPAERKGQVANTEWKRTVFKEGWYPGDSINMGIGQGFTQVTPLQMATLYGFIGTGSKFKPYVVKEIRSKKDEVVYKAEPQEIEVPVSPEVLQIVRKALSDVVDRATGRGAKVEGLLAAGKTGTAENPGLPHAWFVCYAPADKPEIAMAAFIEHGQHGDQAPAHLTREIMKWYKEHRLNGGMLAQAVTTPSSEAKSLPRPKPAPEPEPAPAPAPSPVPAPKMETAPLGEPAETAPPPELELYREFKEGD